MSLPQGDAFEVGNELRAVRWRRAEKEAERIDDPLSFRRRVTRGLSIHSSTASRNQGTHVTATAFVML
jgi:hypothetical protein